MVLFGRLSHRRKKITLSLMLLTVDNMRTVKAVAYALYSSDSLTRTL